MHTVSTETNRIILYQVVSNDAVQKPSISNASQQPPAISQASSAENIDVSALRLNSSNVTINNSVTSKATEVL